jgi:hypothetical protein
MPKLVKANTNFHPKLILEVILTFYACNPSPYTPQSKIFSFFFFLKKKKKKEATIGAFCQYNALISLFRAV